MTPTRAALQTLKPAATTAHPTASATLLPTGTSKAPDTLTSPLPTVTGTAPAGATPTKHPVMKPNSNRSPTPAALDESSSCATHHGEAPTDPRVRQFACTPTPIPQPAATKHTQASIYELWLETPDGLALAAQLYIPPGDGPFPGVVLAHMGGADQRAWSLLPQRLLDLGYVALTFDFRGHGKSQGELDPPSAALDLATALDAVRAVTQVDSERIGLVGASMGGMASVIVGAQDDGVRAVVVMSTSPGAAGQRPIDVVQQLSPRPFLAIGCDNDPITQPERVQELYDTAGEPKHMVILACGAHGTEILGTDAGPELAQLILDWLTQHVR